jgi:hypothetical protein
MNFEFNQEELDQILYVMRVLAPDIGEDRFQILLDAQDYLLASGFLDAVWGNHSTPGRRKCQFG